MVQKRRSQSIKVSKERKMKRKDDGPKEESIICKDEIEVDGSDYTGTNALDLIRIPNCRPKEQPWLIGLNYHRFGLPPNFMTFERKQQNIYVESRFSSEYTCITCALDHTEEEISKSGILDGENARKRRASIITTGIKRRTKGGGGNGGNTRGSTKRSTANTAKSMIRL
ncbi:hypothetical protein GOBAR_AA02070 [Gossypium barbadense]|uniref:Uncharacterized protein n=1 Tax=Gossypium barbadense TaxID=3634 RepID=A0A2P5YSI9_GOSBA|nr:hypothetical protein GOBAR_AA02070 [Gossypium barbadense]